MPLLSELASAVRQRRQEFGWSQQDLAAAADLSRATINALESGKLKDLSARRVERLGNELGFAVGLVRTRRPKDGSAVEAAARTASVSYAKALPADVLLESFREGVVAPDYIPHLRILLQEAPVALLADVVDELFETQGIAKAQTWRSMRTLATALHCDRTLWRTAST
jgi:transcriptional regulator with XRE-family HTH domain